MKEVLSIFESRRDKMLNIIERRSSELNQDEYNQMYGALRELSLIIKTMKHHMDEQQFAEHIDLKPAEGVLHAVTR